MSKERCVFSTLGLDAGMALATSIGSGLELLHNSGSVIAHHLEKRITYVYSLNGFYINLIFYSMNGILSESGFASVFVKSSSFTMA